MTAAKCPTVWGSKKQAHTMSTAKRHAMSRAHACRFVELHRGKCRCSCGAKQRTRPPAIA